MRPAVSLLSMIACLVCATIASLASPCAAESLEAADRDTAIPTPVPEPASEAVAWLQDYLRIDTTNPPGNEAAAVEFLAAILAAEGIRYETAESGPGRKSLWARLKGGDEPALLLLHHSDVVSADASFWDVDPFAGQIVDGYIYGRGALDMKSHGIVHLATFLALQREKTPLNRDVIFMATADEESGSAMGMAWLIANRPGAFAGVGLALTEGGHATRVGDRITLGIEVTQKVPLWLRLEATGIAGHGSTPRTETALGKLLDGLANLRAHDFAPRILPVVDNYFKNLAPNFPRRLGSRFSDIEAAIGDPDFRATLRADFANLAALTQNTCAVTRVAGSDKVNVIGPVAAAEIDCRLLPDEEPVRFLAELQRTIGDRSIWMHPLLTYPPSSSSTDTPLYAAISSVMAEHFAGVDPVPTMSNGFTDSHYLRERGIASYGFSPFLIPLQDTGGLHGNNERISVENVDRGVALLTEIVHEVVNPRVQMATGVAAP